MSRKRHPIEAVDIDALILAGVVLMFIVLIVLATAHVISW
jgi:hypothetical protein